MNLFSRIGIALWGDDNADWSRELGISERAIRRWRNGQNEVPAGVWEALCGHLLAALIKSLPPARTGARRPRDHSDERTED